MKKLLAPLVALTLLLALSASALAESAADVQPLWEAGDAKDKIVVISDIHLGIDDSFSETSANKAYLTQFLARVGKTSDVRELVIGGDFLDEWYLPLDYPAYSDSSAFYRDVIKNNQDVMDAFKAVMSAGIKLVYVPGNHDMLLDPAVLDEALPGVVQTRDAAGLGAYYTGDRNEIVVEHSHRYDVFSAPDTLSNAALCGNDRTMLPAGYFYARYAASWVIEGHPTVAKDLPEITTVPDQSDADQYGAYLYYAILKNISSRITPNEGLDQKIYDVRIAGFDDAYTYLDFYPALQADGTISAPVLYRNIQRTWAEREKINRVKIPNTFVEAVAGTLSPDYFAAQARAQYLDNPDENVDVVVFGHTHVPVCSDFGNGKIYVNDGTWIDHNTDDPNATRTFAVVTTGAQDAVSLYHYGENGTLDDITAGLGKAKE